MSIYLKVMRNVQAILRQCINAMEEYERKYGTAWEYVELEILYSVLEFKVQKLLLDVKNKNIDGLIKHVSDCVNYIAAIKTRVEE